MMKRSELGLARDRAKEFFLYVQSTTHQDVEKDRQLVIIALTYSEAFKLCSSEAKVEASLGVA